jgi:nitric oxide reductase large subunit
MKLFPDTPAQRSFMKKGLPFMLAVVWVPVVWLALSGIFSPLLSPLTSSDLLSQIIILPLTVIVVRLLIRLFTRLSRAFNGSSS